MSKITNLIGTTWRLDGANLVGVPDGHGMFSIDGTGDLTVYDISTGSVLQTLSNVAVSYFAIDNINVAGTFSFDGVTENMFFNRQQINNGVYVNLVYEFTITGGTDISNPLFIDFINTYGTLVSGGEPPTAEGVKSKLQSLITASNAKTGKSDANLTDAVKTLIDGFGSGEGIFAEEENEHGTTIVLGADLQEKTVDITANGTVEVTPDEGYALKKVTANVNVPKDGVDKIQRWIELQGNSAMSLFRGFSGTNLDELLDGVDMSNVTNMREMFMYCSQITTVPLFPTSNNMNTRDMLSQCGKLTVVPPFDMVNVTSTTDMFAGCKLLTECWIRNIKISLQVSSGTSYGHLLTLESLLHLCKECRKTTSSLKLTMGTANLAKLEGIYVKLIDITDEMRAEDDLIDEKYPFVQCESTDEGAMTIQDYMATKKWSLA